MPMQWPQLWLTYVILYSLMISPPMDIISLGSSNISLPIAQPAFTEDAYDTTAESVYYFHQPFHFGVSPFPRVYATDPDSICPVQSILCVECRSDRHSYCRDPFNRTLLNFNDIPYKLCFGYCVKWIRSALIGDDVTHDELYIRTCSSNLNIRFQISPVCLQESHSVNGRLCFCNRPKCNSAPLSRSTASLMNLLLLLLQFLLS